MKLEKLKLLELPDKGVRDWYEMQKEKLTASSIASMTGKCHFTTRKNLFSLK